MKIAVTGKGGVGKTTLTSLLAYTYKDLGFQVLAIDADPSPCLGAALGFPPDDLSKLTPISQMEELIYERTGAKPGTSGGFFKLNPRVDDIPDRFSVMHRDIKLLQLGTISTGGGGCICPEGAIRKIEKEPPEYEYVVDENLCIGCGFCAGACPCGIWNLVENDPLDK